MMPAAAAKQTKWIFSLFWELLMEISFYFSFLKHAWAIPIYCVVDVKVIVEFPQFTHKLYYDSSSWSSTTKRIIYDSFARSLHKFNYLTFLLFIVAATRWWTCLRWRNEEMLFPKSKHDPTMSTMCKREERVKW